ncbi:hypothetical protein MBLNU13_g07242t1 [Cladosporium sp. NU13]
MALSASTLGGALVLALLSRIIYRLYFSPLAKFPGPKIAAITSWYCAYHDIIGGGQYVWVVERMHQKYGPVVRIMPNVLHVNDPSFVDILYAAQSPSQKRERGQTVLNFFQEHLSVLPTRDHDLHRRRRAILSRFFSQQRVRQLAPVIGSTLSDLFQRLERWGDGPFPMSVAYKAATKDVIQAYALGEGDKCLFKHDFNSAFFEVMAAGRLTHISAHFHWFTNLMSKLPPSVITKLSPHVLAFIRFVEGLGTKIEDIRARKASSESRTIFHEILESNTSKDEKATPRLIDEAMVLTIAGTDTTASTLSALTFHILNDVTIFNRLRAELETMMPDADESPDPVKLSTLPFLNALIEEALRLYPSATHRQDRVAPNDDLIFSHPDGEQVIIPAGTITGMTAPLLNRHPNWYEDAESFRPERYLDDPKLLRRHLTFSKGGRQCLGINLAYQELQMFIAGIFRKYKVFDKSLDQQDGPTLELFDTKVEDIKMHADYVSPGLRPGSYGVRVKVRNS